MIISNCRLLQGVLICVLCLSGCAKKTATAVPEEGSATELPRPIDVEQAIKDEAFDQGTIEVEPLLVTRRLQSLAREGGAFVLPVSLAATAEGGVYVSDNNGKSIHYCPPQSASITTLLPQKGQAPLAWPNTIQLSGNSIFVSDNDGIKVFDRQGSFQKLVRSYFGVNHFAVHNDGNIYLNPLFSDSKSSNPLIVKLNSDGSLMGEYGKRLNNASNKGLEDKAFVCVSDKYIFAVFRHRPLIQIYDIGGALVREVTISHPIFLKLAALSHDEKFVHPQQSMFRLPEYIAGASLVSDRLLVLLNLPQPEIVELDFDGKEISRFRGAKLASPTIYMGFDARLIGDNYHFWTIIGDTKNLMALLEMTGSKR